MFVSTQAQDYQKLETLKSKGEIPKEFYSLSSEKFHNQAEKEISDEDARKVSKSKENFLIESNFILDRLLTSGDVIFNDSISQFINKVADEVLKDDKVLRSQIKFYVVKSPYVNAYSTSQGYIIFNIGLLAQLENEAQLAFIISHEIIHYKNKHGINQQVKIDTEIQKQQGSNHDKFLAKTAYSKELESEADLAGLDIYMKTKYSKDVFERVMDVLKYSYLPYDEVPFNSTYLETQYFKINNEYKLKELNPILVDEKEDDSEHTHPNINNRKIALNNALKKFNITDKGQEFIVGESFFNKVRNIARHELSLLFMADNNYGAALYNSYLLLNENPDDYFAQVQTLNTLYFLTKYKNRSDLTKYKRTYLSSVLVDYKDIQGESQQAYFLLESLTREETNVLALNYGWKLKTKHPNDVIISRICDDLILELVEFNNKSSLDYAFLSPAEIEGLKEEAVTKKDSTSATKTLSKYDKIKLNESTKEKIQLDSSNSLKFVFSEFYNDSEFLEKFNTIAEKYKKHKDLIATEAYKKEKKTEEKLIRKKGYALNIDKVIVVDPEYYKVDERKKESVKHIDAEKAQIKCNSFIQQMAEKVDIETYFLNPTDMKMSEVHKFNDLSLLNNWAAENSNHDFEYVSMYQREIDELIARTGISNVSWMGTVVLREKKKYVGGIIILSIMVPYYAPFGLYKILKPSRKLMYYSVTYSLKTGEKIFNEYNEINSKESDSILKSNAYNTFAQMKNKRKTK